MDACTFLNEQADALFVEGKLPRIENIYSAQSLHLLQRRMMRFRRNAISFNPLEFLHDHLSSPIDVSHFGCI